MRISVYSIQEVKPETDEQYEEICETLNTPHLRHGTAEFIGEKVDSVSKTYLRLQRTVAAKFYDRKAACWRRGVLLVEHSNPKRFAECVL